MQPEIKVGQVWRDDGVSETHRYLLVREVDETTVKFMVFRPAPRTSIAKTRIHRRSSGYSPVFDIAIVKLIKAQLDASTQFKLYLRQLKAAQTAKLSPQANPVAQVQPQAVAAPLAKPVTVPANQPRLSQEQIDVIRVLIRQEMMATKKQ